jgi:NifU-like protein involved in Fe-S cluster formation
MGKVKYYSKKIIDIFNGIKHTYIPGSNNEVFGYAGDPKIGEYVYLYFDIDIVKDNVLASIITKASFSAIGSVMLLATAEYLCSAMDGITLREALFKVDPENKDGLYALDVLEGREHSFHFVIQAFYGGIEAISNGSITNSSSNKVSNDTIG